MIVMGKDLKEDKVLDHHTEEKEIGLQPQELGAQALLEDGLTIIKPLVLFLGLQDVKVHLHIITAVLVLLIEHKN
jgi:hypothetical protein